MPLQLPEEEKEQLERQILLPPWVGKLSWPLEVEELGEVVRLRLAKGRNRISFDWSVPEKYQDIVGAARINRVVPKPTGIPRDRDPGHNPLEAQNWARGWLRDQILAAEEQKRMEIQPQAIPNGLRLEQLVARWRESTLYRRKTKQRRQTVNDWDRWCDFFIATLGAEFHMYEVSPDVARQLVQSYQEPWVRTRADGTRQHVEPTANHNGAVKAYSFFRRLCNWGLSEPDGNGGYLLDVDPFARFRDRDHPRPRQAPSRKVGLADDAFLSELFSRAANTGKTGQFRTILAGTAVTGRRLADWRTLSRGQLLTRFDEIRTALGEQHCRFVLPNGFISDNEIAEAANAYRELSGVAVRFTGGKQASRDPASAAQYDRVIPLGPKIGSELLRYVHEEWKPRGLPQEGPLFFKQSNPSEPTHHHVVQNWWVRTEKSIQKDVAAGRLDIRIPDGRFHTLRRRFRTKLRDQPAKVLAFYASWTLSQRAAMNQSYLAIGWRDLIKLAEVADEKLYPAQDYLWGRRHPD